MTRQTEPTRNPNLTMNADPPGWLHIVTCLMVESEIVPERRASRQTKTKAARIRAGARHRIDYFHQHQEPDSQPAEQVIGAPAERYAIEVVHRAIRAMGGKNQVARSLGVPSNRLRGGAGQSDLGVFGQDRLRLMAAEIRCRTGAGQ